MADGLWPGRSEFQELCPGLLITNFFGARSKAKLAAAGVTHVLVCAQELPKVFEGNAALGLTYLRLPLADNPSERIADHFGERRSSTLRQAAASRASSSAGSTASSPRLRSSQARSVPTWGLW